MSWNLRRLALPVVLLASALLGWRNWVLVSRYSVNVLYFDQWNFFTPLFDESPFTTAFLWQVGPVRHGLGAAVNYLVAGFAGWNTRAESLVIFALVFLAMLAALRLKARLLGPLTLTDVAIPLIFMSPVLLGLYVIVPNPAHGALPLLLTVLYCFAWAAPNRLYYVPVLVLNFLLIFTGFGLFMGAITPAVLALELLLARREGERKRTAGILAALAVSLATLAVFFVNYRFEPAADCFQFPHGRPWEYAWYIALMLAAYLRVGGQGLAPTLAGLGCLILLAAVLAYHLNLLLRGRAADERASLAVVILVGFSLVFCLNTAVGRVCTGPGTAQGGRYMPYLVPAFLGLYFHLLTTGREGRLLRYAPQAYLALLLLLSLPLGASGVGVLEHYRQGKSAWKRCYLEREDVEECNRAAGFEIAGPNETRLREKLSYLKRKRLNLYAGE